VNFPYEGNRVRFFIGQASRGLKFLLLYHRVFLWCTLLGSQEAQSSKYTVTSPGSIEGNYTLLEIDTTW